jgi:hypothetical protein
MTIAAVKPISMQQIDMDDLQDVDDIPEAVRFSILLAGEPSSIWAQEFATAYGSIHHPIKPPVDVSGNRIWISYLPRYANDLQSYIDFLKNVVEAANREERRTLEIHEHDTGHKARFREQLKRVYL